MAIFTRAVERPQVKVVIEKVHFKWNFYKYVTQREENSNETTLWAISTKGAPTFYLGKVVDGYLEELPFETIRNYGSWSITKGASRLYNIVYSINNYKSRL